MDLERNLSSFRANDAPPSHQLERGCTVQLRRPADRQLNCFSGEHLPVSGEGNTAAAHVNRFASATFVILSVQELVANFSVHWKTVRSPAFCLFVIQTYLRRLGSSHRLLYLYCSLHGS